MLRWTEREINVIAIARKHFPSMPKRSLAGHLYYLAARDDTYAPLYARSKAAIYNMIRRFDQLQARQGDPLAVDKALAAEPAR